MLNRLYTPVTGRARDVPAHLIRDWMASRTVSNETAEQIFDKVLDYAAGMGFTQAQVEALRSDLTPRMITTAGNSLKGRVVVCKLSHKQHTSNSN